MSRWKAFMERLRPWAIPSIFFLAVGLWLISLIGFSSFTSLQGDDFYSLKGHYAVILHDLEGEERECPDGVFRTVQRGERLEVFLDLSQVPEMETPELYLPLYNAVVKIWSGEKLLYEDVTQGKISDFYLDTDV